MTPGSGFLAKNDKIQQLLIQTQRRKRFLRKINTKR